MPSRVIVVRRGVRRQRPPHRQRRREQRQQHSQRRRSQEDPVLEGRVEDREREEGFDHRSEPGGCCEPGRDPQRNAEQADLSTEQEGPEGERTGLDPEGHADPDLTPLSLDRAADQVEGGEDRRAEQQVGEDVHHFLVAFGVLEEETPGGLPVPPGEREAGLGQQAAHRL
jgi:hypothetical protein